MGNRRYGARIRAAGGDTVFGVYVLSLSIAAALVGSFARGILAQFGFISGFLPAVYVTLGVALMYGATQLLYFALLRIYQPTRSAAMYLTESCGNLAALVLLPLLLGIPVPGMGDDLERAVPLVLFGGFVGLHCVFKLASFYAVLVSPEDHERSILMWALSGVVAGIAGLILLVAWRGSVEAGRVSVTSAEERVQIGSQLAKAREVTEGATLTGEIAPGANPILSFRFANTGTDTEDALGRAYVTVSIKGRDTKLYQGSVPLKPGAWSELSVPAEFFPAGATEFSMYWTRKQEPNWQRILGLRPIVYNVPTSAGEAPPPPARVYISGPNVYSERPAVKTPNLLVVFVDGLSADHLSLFGYPREVTPAIDRLGYRAQLFPNTTSPGAGADFALFAAMTGEDPAQLGGGETSPGLPELLRRAGYATVAFLESGDTDLTRNAPWTNGLDLYDDIRGADSAAANDNEDDEDADKPKAAVSPAVARAREWIADHQTIPFLCVVRVRALADFPPPEAIASGTYKNDDGSLSDIDKYDNALTAVDRQLGELFKFIRDYETRSNTCIVVTAPYGHEFSEGAARNYLKAPSENVPLIIDVPDRKQRKIPKPAKLHDLGATMAYLAGVRLPSTAEGVNLVP